MERIKYFYDFLNANFGWFLLFWFIIKKFNQVVTGLQANYDAKKAPADDQKADKNKKKKWKKKY